jgi:hypothetical protein
MKKYSRPLGLSLLAISLLIFAVAFGQNENSAKPKSFALIGMAKNWKSQRTESVALDSSRNIYVAGIIEANGKIGVGIKTHTMLLKFDKNGIFAWGKSWGGSGKMITSDYKGMDYAYSMAIDANDNIYLAGSSYSFGAGRMDVLLLKYNKEGELLWSKTWGGPEYDYASDMALDSSGNIYIAGSTDSYGSGSDDILLLKYNKEGELLWSKAWGGRWINSALAMTLDSYGNVYLTGHTGIDTAPPLPVRGEGGRSNIVLLKYNKSGTLLWSKTWGGRRGDKGKAIVADSNGNIYVAGETQRYEIKKNVYILHSHNVVLLKYSKNGDLLWNKTWVEDPKWGTGVSSMSIDQAGYIYILGTKNLLKYDKDGKLLWSKSGYPSIKTAMALDIFESILLVGNYTGSIYKDLSKSSWREKNGILGGIAYRSSSPKGSVNSPKGTIGSPSGIEGNLLWEISNYPHSYVFLSRYVQ